MATTTINTPRPMSITQPVHLAPGLAWAGLMTLLAMVWLGRKYTLPMFYPVLLGGVAAGFLGLAGWRLYGRLRGPLTDEASAKQRGVVSLYLLGAGIFLAFSGLFFFWSYGLAALGEGVGLLLFGIMLVGAGSLLTARPRDESTSKALRLAQEEPRSCGMMLIGLACILTIAYWVLVFSGVARRGGLPEVIGLGLIVLVCAGVGMYLLQTEGKLPSTSARIVVLTLGGLIGLCLFITVVGRTFAWRDTTLFGGLAAWQGPHSWRIWLCAYLGMLSLALMSGSLLLSRADIRTSPLLRRVFFGYNTVVTTLLLLLVLVIANVVVFAMFPYQFDWTSNRGIYTLSENSKRLLHRLDKKVQAYVILSKSSLFHELHTLLENAQAEAPTKFSYKHLSPDADKAEMKELGDRFPAVFQTVPKFGTVPRRGGLLLVYGDLPDDPKKPIPHAFVNADDLFKDNQRERKRDEPIVQEFTGEVELMKSISTFVAEKKPRVYVLQDNGELKINAEKLHIRGDNFSESLAEQGGSFLKKFLVQEKYEVFGLSFSAAPKGKTEPDIVFLNEDPKTKKKEIPIDAGFLIVAGPSQPLSPETLAAIDHYLEKGGKLLAYLDTFTDRDYTKFVNSGLEDVLKKYGIEVTNEYVLSPARTPLVAEALTPTLTDNGLALAFKGFEIYTFTPRVLRPGPPGKYDVETLLEVGPKILLTSDPRILKNPAKHFQGLFASKKLEANLTRTKTAVAMAATLRSATDKKPQIYVFGDAEFVSDGLLTALKRNEGLESQDMLHLEWVRSPMEYSSTRPGFVGPKPRKVTNFKAKADTNYTAMSLVPGWVMAMSLIGLGAGLWIVRRR